MGILALELLLMLPSHFYLREIQPVKIKSDSSKTPFAMKNYLLLLAFLIVGIYNGYGQSKKSDLKLTIAGLPLFGASDAFTSGLNGLVLKPSVGYFITDKTSIDINFSYATLNDLKVGRTDSYYNSFAFVPTLRNNFVNKEKIRLFAEIGFGLGTIRYDADNSALRNAEHQALSGGISILNIGLGGNYFFSENFGVELIIPYINTKNITSENSNRLYSGIGPTLGLTYVID